MSRDVNGAAKGSRLLLLKVMSVTLTRKVGCDFVISGLRREWGLLEAGGPCCSCDDWGPCDMMTVLLFHSDWGWAGGWSEQSGLPRRELGLLL
jgi:hypothetical protein